MNNAFLERADSLGRNSAESFGGNVFAKIDWAAVARQQQGLADDRFADRGRSAAVLPDVQFVGIGTDAPPKRDVRTGDGGAYSPTGSSKPFLKGIRDFREAFESLYPRLQHDKHGGITLATLNKAIQSPYFTGSDAQVLAVLKTNFNDLKKHSDGSLFGAASIDKKAMALFFDAIDKELNFLQKTEGKPNPLQDIVQPARSIVALAQANLKDQAGALFANSDSVKSVRPDSITQPYGIGDCYLEAAMASLALTRPGDIVKMIQENKNGTFTVRFPGAPDTPITVPPPTQGEILTYGGESKDGIWPWVIRKAYGRYLNESFWRRGPYHPTAGGTDIEGVDGGSAFDAGIRILTGHGIDKDFCSLSRYSTIDRHLHKALNGTDRKVVTATTLAVGLSNTTKDNFLRGHDYSVVKYEPNPSKPSEGMITVRDPDTSGGRGVYHRMSLQKFCKNFLSLDYEE